MSTETKAPEINSEEYQTYLENRQRQRDVDTARCRMWAYTLGAYFTGPIWTGVIAARTNEWMPFAVGSAVGVVSLPLAFLDLGILTSIPATVTCAVMMNKKVEEKRRKLGVIVPEQADVLRFSQF